MKKGFKSQFFSNLKYDDDMVDIIELLLGIDQIELDDSLHQLQHRYKEFINFKDNRMLVDS